MTLKKRLLAVSLSSMIALLACGTQAKVLKVAEVQPAGYPTVVALEHMGEKLKQATDGRLEMKVYAGGVLGDADQTLQQVQLGAIDMIRVSLAPVTTIAPETSVLTLPFIFRDEDHMHKVLDGSVGEQVVDKFKRIPTPAWYFSAGPMPGRVT